MTQPPSTIPGNIPGNIPVNIPVTIIVVPRERFQFTQDTLESLYENTHYPFKLIYIDNNAPLKTRQYLEQQAEEKDFELVQLSHYHSPNQARNVGLKRVKTPYVVFVDNDVMFSPGWLTALVTCAQETGASVVGSLVCQYQPLHTIVHCIGGDYMDTANYMQFSRGERGPQGTITDAGQWEIEEKTYHQNRPVAEVKDCLHRQTVGFVEFHAMLVRTSLFNRIGFLDEGFSCTKEYLDFCMTVTRAGGIIYLEPTSVVTFLTHPPAPRLQWRDLPYFMLRWSDEWEEASLKHFQRKWNLAHNSYFQKRYKKLGQRRRKEMIKPIAAKFSFLGRPMMKWIENRLVRVEKIFNRAFSERYRRSVSQSSRKAVPLEPFPEAPDKLNHLTAQTKLAQTKLSPTKLAPTKLAQTKLARTITSADKQDTAASATHCRPTPSLRATPPKRGSASGLPI